MGRGRSVFLPTGEGVWGGENVLFFDLKVVNFGVFLRDKFKFFIKQKL